jgi:hypothetical protein
MRSAIAYVRVSTTGQGKSGLGLEAQGEAIARFAAQEGFHIVHSFAEIETGKGADALDGRPKLAAALKAARGIDKACPVIVAKLDLSWLTRGRQAPQAISPILRGQKPPTCRACSPQNLRCSSTSKAPRRSGSP